MVTIHTRELVLLVVALGLVVILVSSKMKEKSMNSEKSPVKVRKLRTLSEKQKKLLPKVKLEDTELPFLETNPDGTSSEFIFEEDTDKKGGPKSKRVGKLPKGNGGGSTQNRGRSNPLSRSEGRIAALRSGKATKADGLASSEGSGRKTSNRQKVSSVSDKRVP